MGKVRSVHLTGKHTFLGKKIPVAYTFVFLLFSIAITYLVTREFYPYSSAFTNKGESMNSPYHIKRLTGFKFIRPLLSAKPIYENPKYGELKKKISDLIIDYKDHGLISSASFYLRDFDQSNWTGVNQTEKYFPGSIIKIPILMTILKTEQDHPGFLNEGVIYNIHFIYTEPKKPYFISKQIEFGKIYSNKELLKYMIEYSDNNAAQMLWLKTDKELMKKMFVELGLPELDLTKNNISLTVLECSVFLESLFNATYLNPEQSEFAIDLLTKSSFTEGIVQGIPESKLLIAHKFGEAGTENLKELHETAILYIENQPFLLTIMTRGKKGVDFLKLSSVIQGISREAYDGLIKLSKLN